MFSILLIKTRDKFFCLKIISGNKFIFPQKRFHSIVFYSQDFTIHVTKTVNINFLLFKSVKFTIVNNLFDA